MFSICSSPSSMKTEYFVSGYYNYYRWSVLRDFNSDYCNYYCCIITYCTHPPPKKHKTLIGQSNHFYYAQRFYELIISNSAWQGQLVSAPACLGLLSWKDSMVRLWNHLRCLHSTCLAVDAVDQGLSSVQWARIPVCGSQCGLSA